MQQYISSEQKETSFENNHHRICDEKYYTAYIRFCTLHVFC